MVQVNITISEEKLAQLMDLGVLSGSEISSEDLVVKNLVQAMCIKGCSRKICANCSFSDSCGTHSYMGEKTTYIPTSIKLV